jgi:hypothetical protein
MNSIISKAILIFSEFATLFIWQGLIFTNGVPSTDASRAWAVVSTCRSWLLSPRSWDVKWICKQSAVTTALYFGWHVIPKGPWRAVGAFGPSHFIRDFTIGNRAWGVTSHFRNFVSHASSAFLLVMSLIILATQLSVLLHAGSWVTRHTFLNLPLCFSKLSRPGISLLMSESLFLFVDSLYA